MNVHRWRVLGGKDPSAMELLDKVNQLQKRLMSKTNVSHHMSRDVQHDPSPQSQGFKTCVLVRSCCELLLAI